MDMIDRAYTKKLVNGLSSGYLSSSVTDNADGSKILTINFVNGDKADVTFSPVKGDKGDTGTSVQYIKIQEISGVRHLIVTLDDATEIDAGILPNEQYDDTAIKADIATNTSNIAKNTSDISDLKTDKQDKTDNTLETTDKTVTGAINEVNGNSLDTVGFSADYKNIILNRKSGLNPYTIPISAIINNAKLVELGDVDDTDIGNGKTLVYDGTTNKHKYVDSAGTDELVKMEASTDAKYLSDLIDKSTIVNDNGTLKVKKLDGQEVTITEINYLKGLTMNVMDLVNMFSNGGVKIINTPVATYADLLTYDKSALIDGISYLIYVLADETHDGSKTTYLIDKNTATPTYFGYADSHREFTTNPIDLANEVTGKLGTDNIDVDSLWSLLTINDTYKTLTTNNEAFGTHGAKALYDELVTAIGAKANDDDLTTHTSDTDIHVTTTDKDKWNKVTDKVDTTDFETHTGDTDIHVTADKQTKWDKTSTDFTTHSEDTDIHTSATEKASYVLKESITTTINSSSTDEQVPSAKVVYDLHKNSKLINVISWIRGITITFTVQSGASALILLQNGACIPIYTAGSTANIDRHVKAICSSGYNFTWGVDADNKLKITLNCGAGNMIGSIIINNDPNATVEYSTTDNPQTKVIPNPNYVSDVAKTNITFINETNYKVITTNETYYIVKNGICFVHLVYSCVATTNSDINLFSGLPTPASSVYTYDISKPYEYTNYSKNNVRIRVNTSGVLSAVGGTNSIIYVSNFSYPVANS